MGYNDQSMCLTCGNTGIVPTTQTSAREICPDCHHGERRAIRAKLASTLKWHKPNAPQED